MDPSQLYDNGDYTSSDYSDLAGLGGPEISLNLQGLIDDSQFNDGLIQDIQGLSVTAPYRNLPGHHAGMTPTTVPGAVGLCQSPLTSPGGRKKNVDKSSKEYEARRNKNNIAVRKCREKAKVRAIETEERVKKLIMDNDRLHKSCELLSKEITMFHSIFANVNLPEHVQRELRKQMEALTRQHQQLVNM